MRKFKATSHSGRHAKLINNSRPVTYWEKALPQDAACYKHEALNKNVLVTLID